MDPRSIMAYALQALDLVPRLVSAGSDIAAYISKTTGVIKAAQDNGQPIHDAAWDELKSVREGLQKRLHAP